MKSTPWNQPSRGRALRDSVTNSRVVLGSRTLLTILLVVAFAALLLFLARDEIRLDLHHDHARGQVVGTYSQSRGPGGAVVRFRAGARAVQANVPKAWFSDAPRVGSALDVEYDPDHPSRARRDGSHDYVGLGLPVVAVAALLLLRRRLRR